MTNNFMHLPLGRSKSQLADQDPWLSFGKRNNTNGLHPTLGSEMSWMVATQLRSGTINITTTLNVGFSLTGACVSLRMGAVSIVVFTLLVPSKNNLPVVEGTVGGEAVANVPVEKRDLPMDKERAAPEKTAHLVEENAAAQDLKPNEGECVADEALTPES